MNNVSVIIRRPTKEEWEKNNLENFFWGLKKPRIQYVYAVEFPDGTVHYTYNDFISRTIGEYKTRNGLL